MQSTKSADLIDHIKFLPWRQLSGCNVTRPFLSLWREWLARLTYMYSYTSHTPPPTSHTHSHPHQVKQIEKRDAVLTSAQQIDRLLKPGSKYLNLNPYEVHPIKSPMMCVMTSDNTALLMFCHCVLIPHTHACWPCHSWPLPPPRPAPPLPKKYDIKKGIKLLNSRPYLPVWHTCTINKCPSEHCPCYRSVWEQD